MFNVLAGSMLMLMVFVFVLMRLHELGASVRGVTKQLHDAVELMREAVGCCSTSGRVQ